MNSDTAAPEQQQPPASRQAGAFRHARFTTAHRAALQAALLDSFTQQEFDQLWVIERGFRLEQVVSVGDHNFGEIAGAALAWMLRTQKDGAQELLAAALRSKPGSPALRALQEQWAGVTFTYVADCPYPGMRPFEETRSDQFFGRSNEIEHLRLRLHKQPITAIVGSSGSGKSSLLHAGLIPVLRKTGWEVRTLRPAGQPLANLHAAMAGLFAPGATPHRSLAISGPILLAIDQFEETFTQGKADAERFLAELLKLPAVEGLHIVLALRADYYDTFINTQLWPHVEQGVFTLGQLSRQGLAEAIRLPAEQAGVSVEGVLLERLLNESSGEPGALPFLQETLALLWEGMEEPVLKLDAYERLTAGYDTQLTGLQVAMALHADRIYAGFKIDTAGGQLRPDGEQRQAFARRIFMRLVQFGEGRSDTRRQQAKSQLLDGGDATIAASVIEQLVEGRLLTSIAAPPFAGPPVGAAAPASSGSPAQPVAAHAAPGEQRYDISHEKLITGWPQLQQWIAALKSAELARRRLEEKAAEHQRLGEDSGLLDAKELREAQDYVQSDAGRVLGVGSGLNLLIERSSKALNPGFLLRGVLTLAGLLLSTILWLGVLYLATIALEVQVQAAIWLSVALAIAVGAVITWFSLRDQLYWPQHLTQKLGRRHTLAAAGALIAASIAAYAIVGAPMIRQIQECQSPPRSFVRPAGGSIHVGLVNSGVDSYSVDVLRGILANVPAIRVWLVSDQDVQQCRGFFSEVVTLQPSVTSTQESVILASIAGEADSEQPRTVDDTCFEVGQLGYKLALAIDPSVDNVEIPQWPDEMTITCRAWSLNNAAKAALASGDSAQAETLLQQALADEPDYAIAYLSLGDVYWEQDRDRALAAYAKASQLAPASPAVHYKLAGVYRELWLEDSSLDHFDQAERHYRTVLAAAPSYVPAYSGLANLYVLAEVNLDEAHRLLDTATAQLAHSTQFSAEQKVEFTSLLGKNYGLLAIAEHDYETAVQVLQEALVLSDEYELDILDSLVVAYLGLGRQEEACAALEQIERALQKRGWEATEWLVQQLDACRLP